MNQLLETSATADQILNGLDYFYCDRYKCRMKKSECVRRQTTPERNSHEIDYTWVSCKDCEQGRQIAVETPGRASVRKRRRRPPRLDIIKKVEAQRTASVDEYKEERYEMATTKICSKCKREKDVKEFHVKKNTPDGLDYKCKQCKSDYAKERNARIKSGVNKPDSRRKKAKPNSKAVSGEIVPSNDISLSQDIAMLETQNKESMKEAAKYIIASVKKDLLGAVFQELRSK